VSPSFLSLPEHSVLVGVTFYDGRFTQTALALGRRVPPPRPLNSAERRPKVHGRRLKVGFRSAGRRVYRSWRVDGTTGRGSRGRWVIWVGFRWRVEPAASVLGPNGLVIIPLGTPTTRRPNARPYRGFRVGARSPSSGVACRAGTLACVRIFGADVSCSPGPDVIIRFFGTGDGVSRAANY